MPYPPEITDELRLLTQFNLDTNQAGIKVHSTAEPSMIAAAERLYAKGIITQPDGGYLTPLGRTAAEHTQSLLQILNVKD